MKIGLSQRVFYHKGRAYDAIEHGWYSYLKNHTLVPLPNRLDQEFHHLAQELDAFIITGGDDSAIRRTTELKLATAIMAEQKPVVGICHGCFLLTDVLGGTVGEIDNHADTEHTINYFGQQINVNSYHTLSVDKTHKGATILATDNQGYCESWIDGNLAGVVWHPERMAIPFLPTEINLLLKI